MTDPVDARPIFDAKAYPAAPEGLPPVEDLTGVGQPQEINARRARVENAELLEHLRGL